MSKIVYVLKKVEDIKDGEVKRRCKICDFGHSSTCHQPGGCKEGYAWKREQKPAVDEGKQAMESVLTKIAGEFGTPVGDVFALAEAIHDFKEQKKRWAEKILDNCITVYNGETCDFCGDECETMEQVEHLSDCIVLEAKQYLESLEGE